MIEGLFMIRHFIPLDIGVVLMDFSGNGLSDGEYNTLGYKETLDLNRVIRFLYEDINCSNIALWGRSMGANCILYYMSKKFREKFS